MGLEDREEVACPVEVLSALRWQAGQEDVEQPVPGEEEVHCFVEPIRGEEFHVIEQCFPFAPEQNPDLEEFQICSRVKYKEDLSLTGLSYWNPDERVKLEISIRKKECDLGPEGVVSCIHTLYGNIPITPDMVENTENELQAIREALVSQLQSPDIQQTPLEYRMITEPADEESMPTLTPVGAFISLRSWVGGQREFDLASLLYDPNAAIPVELGWNQQMLVQMRDAFRKVGIQEHYFDQMQEQFITLATTNPDWFWERDNENLIVPEVQLLDHSQLDPEFCKLVPLDAGGHLAQRCHLKNLESGHYSVEDFNQLLRLHPSLATDPIVLRSLSPDLQKRLLAQGDLETQRKIARITRSPDVQHEIQLKYPTLAPVLLPDVTLSDETPGRLSESLRGRIRVDAMADHQELRFQKMDYYLEDVMKEMDVSDHPRDFDLILHLVREPTGDVYLNLETINRALRRDGLTWEELSGEEQALLKDCYYAGAIDAVIDDFSVMLADHPEFAHFSPDEVVEFLNARNPYFCE